VQGGGGGDGEGVFSKKDAFMAGRILVLRGKKTHAVKF